MEMSETRRLMILAAIRLQNMALRPPRSRSRCSGIKANVCGGVPGLSHCLCFLRFCPSLSLNSTSVDNYFFKTGGRRFCRDAGIRFLVHLGPLDYCHSATNGSIPVFPTEPDHGLLASLCSPQFGRLFDSREFLSDRSGEMANYWPAKIANL